MNAASAPGRVVMVVANRVDGDSRVQKAAASMAEAGWEVHLLGFTTGAKKEHYRLGGAQVHRVPIPKLKPAASLRRLVGALRHPLAYGDPVRADQEPARIRSGWIELEALARERGTGLLRLPLVAHRLGRKVQRVWIGRRVAHSRAKDRYLKRRDGKWEAIERRWWPLLLGDRAWRRLEPDAERIELALRPEILRLEPDLLHAHDVYPLGVCVRAAAHLGRGGRDVKVLYDAHEFVPGCDSFGPTRLAALTRFERRYLPDADAVVTVSKPLAELLQRTHGLDREPRVVHNAPPIEERTDRPDPGDLRSACGVPDGAPLAVYSGAAGPERQLEVMIEAARELPDLHVAFMLGSLTTPYAKSLISLGERLGVSDRLHFRGYVHYADLPRFLATADVGVVPIQVGPINHEVCLASKFFEYAHADLPVVVSNTAAMSNEVRRLGNGEVFRGGDAADLAAALRRVLAGPDAYREAYRDPEVLAEFTWERQVRTYVDAYEELIGPAVPAEAAEDTGPGLREQCATGLPIVAVLGAEDEHWAATAVRALAGLAEAHVALVSADPDVRARLAAGTDPARVSIVAPAVPLEDFLAAAEVAVLPPGDFPAYLAPAIAAGVPVVAESVAIPLAGIEVGETWDRSDPATLAAAVRKVRAGTYPVDAARAWARLGTPTPWPRLGDSPIRLGMGTANFAGQLAELARAVSWHRADTTAEVVAADAGSPLRFPADEYFAPREADQPAFQAARVRRVIGDYSHLLIDALRPAFGRLNGGSTEGDLPMLRGAKVRTALLMHGSEVRDPDAHLAKHEHSPYRDASPEDLATLRRNTPNNRRIAAESGFPLFVTTPDLLDDLPQATWLPLTVDVDRWQSSELIMERPRPLVLHAPSTRWAKGTAAVVPVLEDLHRQGVIDFRLAEGVAPGRMRQFVREADIVIDQLAIGAYGVFACESMAAGKPVIAYLHESTAARIGEPVPIVNATAKTLEESLVALCEDRDRARLIGAESRRYARRLHDGRAAVAVLRDFLES